MPDSVPTSIEAVESRGISIVYYARHNGDLASLTAQKVGEGPTFPLYKSANILLNNKPVTAAVPQVTAYAYKINTNFEIRLFFIGGSEPDYHIREICKTNDDDWREGALSGNRFSITKDSLLSANYEENTGHYKVFYNGKNDKKETVPFVAWAIYDKDANETWSQRPIGEWE